MSTEFRTVKGDYWVCTRYAGTRHPGELTFDFGSVERFNHLEQLALVEAVPIYGEDGVETNLTDLLVYSVGPALCMMRVADDGTVYWSSPLRMVPTFGRFGGTVAVGDGEIFDRLGITGWPDNPNNNPS